MLVYKFKNKSTIYTNKNRFDYAKANYEHRKNKEIEVFELKPVNIDNILA
jgi:hypothetical protein